jgi:hypothetical protein
MFAADVLTASHRLERCKNNFGGAAWRFVEHSVATVTIRLRAKSSRSKATDPQDVYLRKLLCAG